MTHPKDLRATIEQLVGAMKDALFSLQVPLVSCQNGMVKSCGCRKCAIERGDAALTAAAEYLKQPQGEVWNADPSYSTVKLAEMILSDCGCSTNNTSLVSRVANRIDRHMEATHPQASEPALPVGEPAPEWNDENVIAYCIARGIKAAEQIVQPAHGEQPLQGLASYLRCIASTELVYGSEAHQQHTQWAREIDAILASASTQPVREPLTNEQIEDLWVATKTGANATNKTARHFARAIESHHGITKKGVES